MKRTNLRYGLKRTPVCAALYICVIYLETEELDDEMLIASCVSKEGKLWFRRRKQTSDYATISVSYTFNFKIHPDTTTKELMRLLQERFSPVEASLTNDFRDFAIHPPSKLDQGREGIYMYFMNS